MNITFWFASRLFSIAISSTYQFCC